MEKNDSYLIKLLADEEIEIPFVEEIAGLRRYRLELTKEDLEKNQKERLIIRVDLQPMTPEEIRLAELRKKFDDAGVKLGSAPDNS